MNTQERTGVRGIVRITLKDKEGNRKALFQNNKLWDVVYKLFGVDLKLPFITGNWTLNTIVHNTITDVGIGVFARRMGGVTEDAISHMGIGIGTPSTTALGSEIASGGGTRVAVTPTNVTTTITEDTVRCNNTYAFTSSFAITEEGLFNALSSGEMVASRSFSAINVSNGDSLEITHDIVLSTS